jgi:hypothetical protein
VLAGVVVTCFVLSLGTELHVAGDGTGVWMPWSLLHSLPVFDHVISARFWVYAVLAIALATALWLAAPAPRPWLRWVVAGAGLALLIPNVSSDFWDGRPTDPPFFESGTYKRYLEEGETMLALPYARYGSSMLWQARADMDFKMVEGYVSPEYPPDYVNDPFFGQLISSRLSGLEDVAGLRDFLRRRNVTAVVIEAEDAGPWPAVLDGLGLDPVRTGGVIFYRVPPDVGA